MKKILINISRGYKIHDYYDTAYKDLYNKHGIETIVFFDKNLSGNTDISNDNYGYKIDFYNSKEELLDKINSINKENIYYINTFEEVLIPLVHEIRLNLGFVVSDEYISFRNKHIQRKILSEIYPETTVNYFHINIEKDDINSYYNKLDFPYIIKPSSGVQSSGVSIINNKTELDDYVKNAKFLNQNMLSRGIQNDVFLLEEFIDGEMYTIVYFVDNYGNISYTPVVKVNGAKKLGIDDFFNYVRINGLIVDSELDNNEIKIFIEKMVKSFGIKNTFIFQDFKKNSKGILKNIELNARIGGYRLEIFQNLYNYNLLEMPLLGNRELSSDSSNAVFVFYPEFKGVLKEINNSLLESFKKLNSYSSIRISTQKIGEEIGPTKEGFGSIAALRIKNNNLEQFKSDFDFVEKNYKNLLILETKK